MIAVWTRRLGPFARAALVAMMATTVLGCDLVKPSPSASLAAAAPSSAPSPTNAISSAELVGHHYVLAVVDAFRTDPLALHVYQTGQVTTTQGKTSVKATVTMTLDLSGRNLRSHMTIASGGKTTKADLVVVGKSAYARSGSGKWKKAPRNGYEKSVSDIIKAMRLVDDPTALRYVALETIDRRALYHLTANRPIPYVASNGATGQYDTFDVWIAEDGTPVLVKTRYSAKLGTITVKGTTEYSFAKFGGPITIAAPKTK